MKKLRFFVSIQLVLGLLISVPLLAATELEVTGKGMVSVAPDEATITAQVSLVDRDAGKAQARASKEVDAMLSAIKSFSLKPDSLNASDLSLLPEYRWDRATDQQQFIGFRVTRTISFTIAEIDRTGAALSALANAVAPVSPISLHLRFTFVIVEFPSKASGNAAAPVAPILLPCRLTSVIVAFTLNASANAVAPVALI